MPVPSLISDLSTTAASNFPQGSDSPSSLDDVQRAHASFIATIRNTVGLSTGTLVPATARTNFGAAASGANSDITSLSGLSAGGIPVSKISGAAASGANSDITSLSGLTTPLSIAQGGTGGTSGAVLLSGSQTIAGTKTFSSQPVLPEKITLGSAVATTSGVSVDISSIPSWAKRITLQLVGVSTTGTSPLMVLIGDSGGVETSGYLGGSATSSSGVTSSSSNSSGFLLESGGAFTAAALRYGHIQLTNADASNTWVMSSVTALTAGNVVSQAAGGKQLSAQLDRLQLSTAGGVDTFDAGSIVIIYD